MRFVVMMVFLTLCWLAGASVAAAAPKAAAAKASVKASAGTKTKAKTSFRHKYPRYYRQGRLALVSGLLSRRAYRGAMKQHKQFQRLAAAFIRRGKLKQKQTLGYKRAYGQASRALFIWVRRGKMRQKRTISYRKAHSGALNDFVNYTNVGMKGKGRLTLRFKTFKKAEKSLSDYVRRVDQFTSTGFNKVYNDWKKARAALMKGAKSMALFTRRGKIKQKTTFGYGVRMTKAGNALKKHNGTLPLRKWTHVVMSHSK